jgi:hypothetical protein
MIIQTLLRSKKVYRKITSYLLALKMINDVRTQLKSELKKINEKIYLRNIVYEDSEDIIV